MRTFILAVAVALLLAACSQDERGDVSQETPDRRVETRTDPQPTQIDATSTGAVEPQTDLGASKRAAVSETADLTVQLTEWSVTAPDTLAAGQQRFRVTNAGKEKHGLAIEGNGVNVSLQNPLSRGDSGEINVPLQPGTYTLYCPVDGHRGKGMERKVTVR